jgi:hypothetical protein
MHLARASQSGREQRHVQGAWHFIDGRSWTKKAYFDNHGIERGDHAPALSGAERAVVASGTGHCRRMALLQARAAITRT